MALVGIEIGAAPRRSGRRQRPRSGSVAGHRRRSRRRPPAGGEQRRRNGSRGPPRPRRGRPRSRTGGSRWAGRRRPCPLHGQETADAGSGPGPGWATRRAVRPPTAGPIDPRDTSVTGAAPDVPLVGTSEGTGAVGARPAPAAGGGSDRFGAPEASARPPVVRRPGVCLAAPRARRACSGPVTSDGATDGWGSTAGVDASAPGGDGVVTAGFGAGEDAPGDDGGPGTTPPAPRPPGGWAVPGSVRAVRSVPAAPPVNRRPRDGPVGSAPPRDGHGDRAPSRMSTWAWPRTSMCRTTGARPIFWASSSTWTRSAPGTATRSGATEARKA